MMDAKTLEALRGSIAKWEAIVAGTGNDEGRENCPLCLMFNNVSMSYEQQCKGCPVAESVGDDHCGNTPYDEFSLAKLDFPPDLKTMRKVAVYELAFLESLLPEGEAP